MKITNLVLILAFCFSAVSLSSKAQTAPATLKDQTPAKSLVSLFPISMIAVLANPDRYKGKGCRINGFLHLQYEDQHLYVSKEAADFLCSENAIELTLDKDVHLEPSVRFRRSLDSHIKVPVQHFDEKMVMLEGVFDKSLNLHVSRILELDFYKNLK
ncbi:MAG: hypothetical protein IPL73_21115 [Candidatus Obscuribacter sp.]|nr:hypothetical protein [Candidatus Obscuribacter sp.]